VDVRIDGDFEPGSRPAPGNVLSGVRVGLMNGPIPSSGIDDEAVLTVYSDVGNIVWEYMSTDESGRRIGEVSGNGRMFIMNTLFDIQSCHEEVTHGGKSLVVGNTVISTFYDYNPKDARGRDLSARIAVELSQIYRTNGRVQIVDPNSVSNLQVLNGALEHRGSAIWGRVSDGKDQDSLEDILANTVKQRRWAIAYLCTLDRMLFCFEMIFCFIVKMRNGRYEVGPGQEMEIKYAKAMINQAASKALKLHFYASNDGINICERQIYENDGARRKLEELEATAFFLSSSSSSKTYSSSSRGGGGGGVPSGKNISPRPL